MSARGGQFCVSPFELTELNFPDSWYKGQFISEDNIWEIGNDAATMISSPSRTIGRSLDIINLQITTDGKMLYFINRIDNTLWLYEI